MEVRDGRIWCTRHECFWKDRRCDCPPDFVVMVPITQEVLDSVKPDKGAFLKAMLESRLEFRVADDMAHDIEGTAE